MTDKTKPSSSRVRWWRLAFALLAIPAAFAKRKQEIADPAPYSDMPEPPEDLAEGFVKDIVVDQKKIWTSPFRMTRQNAK